MDSRGRTLFFSIIYYLTENLMEKQKVKYQEMKRFFIGICLLGILLSGCHGTTKKVVVYPAPESIELNRTYRVSVEGLDVPVYNAKIGMEEKADRERAMDRVAESANYFDLAGFASFDLVRGPVSVTVTVDDTIREAKILPSSRRITPVVQGKTVSFSVSEPSNLTVEINGGHIRSLHLFVNPEEKDRPDPDDPDVIYFGPGVHEVSSLVVGPGKTVYVAGGAVVRCVTEDSVGYVKQTLAQLRDHHRSSFRLEGDGITLRGRGIIDHELVPTHNRKLLYATGEDLKIEGVIFCNSALWTVLLQECRNAHIDNIKIFGHRANSDGIDICSSFDVVVENCFLRTLDDLIVVKTLKGMGEAGRITVRKCVLWNEVAHALSLGAELTRDVDGVTFEDCDIIGDHGREWALRIYHTDAGTIRNVRFENIRIEECVRFASLWIDRAHWSSDGQRGRIEHVVFKDIAVTGPGPLEAGMEFLGFDAGHAIDGVLVENVTINGQRIPDDDIVKNDFVYNLEVK